MANSTYMKVLSRVIEPSGPLRMSRPDTSWFSYISLPPVTQKDNKHSHFYVVQQLSQRSFKSQINEHLPGLHPHLNCCATLCERKAEDKERFCFPDWTATCLGIGELDTLQDDWIIQHIPGDYQDEVAISKALNSDCNTQSAEVTSGTDQELSRCVCVCLFLGKGRSDNSLTQSHHTIAHKSSFQENDILLSKHSNGWIPGSALTIFTFYLCCHSSMESPDPQHHNSIQSDDKLLVLVHLHRVFSQKKPGIVAELEGDLEVREIALFGKLVLNDQKDENKP